MTSHRVLHITDAEAAWAATEARQSRRTPHILTVGVMPDRMMEDELVRAVLALTNSPTGGVCFIGINHHFLRTKECPSGVEAQVAEILARRLTPVVPPFVTYRRDGIVAVAVESLAVGGLTCIDIADGNRPLFFTAESGAVHGLIIDAHGTELRAGTATVDAMALPGFTGRSVVDRRVTAHLGLDPASFDGPECLLRAGGELLAVPDARRILPGSGFELQRHTIGRREAGWFERAPNLRIERDDSPLLLLDLVAEHLIEWNRGFVADERMAVAAREFFVNAIAHRVLSPLGHSIAGPGILVRLFPDAVTFESYGPPPGAFVGIVGGRFTDRWSRNPLMASLLTSSGFMEQHGAGFARVLDLFASSDLTVSAELTGDRTVVSLRVRGPEHRRNFRLGSLTPPATADPTQRSSGSSTRGKRRASPTPRSNSPLTVEIERVLRGEPKGITAIAEELRRPRSTVAAAVKRLVTARRLVGTEANPRSPKQRYRPT